MVLNLKVSTFKRFLTCFNACEILRVKISIDARGHVLSLQLVAVRAGGGHVVTVTVRKLHGQDRAPTDYHRRALELAACGSNNNNNKMSLVLLWHTATLSSTDIEVSDNVADGSLYAGAAISKRIFTSIESDL